MPGDGRPFLELKWRQMLAPRLFLVPLWQARTNSRATRSPEPQALPAPSPWLVSSDGLPLELRAHVGLLLPSSLLQGPTQNLLL